MFPISSKRKKHNNIPRASCKKHIDDLNEKYNITCRALLAIRLKCRSVVILMPIVSAMLYTQQQVLGSKENTKIEQASYRVQVKPIELGQLRYHIVNCSNAKLSQTGIVTAFNPVMSKRETNVPLSYAIVILGKRVTNLRPVPATMVKGDCTV